MARVFLDGVTKRYGDVTAVRDLTLEAHDGEFLVLVGPSGCGKSTALRMVAGLEDITEGDLYIGERRVNDMAAKDRDIAMVFQSYALYPHMSVYDNMAFGLKLRKLRRAEIDRRVNEAAEMLGIKHLLNRKPRALSGGQRQRVAVGRAIVREPQAFLFDEPLSNLDAKLRVQTRADLVRLHQRLQTTSIYVTHDQVEAMTMGSRIAVMRDGVLQQVDTPQTLYERPANLFVAGFIGSPAMNVLRMGVKVDDGQVRLTRSGSGEAPATGVTNSASRAIDDSGNGSVSGASEAAGSVTITAAPAGSSGDAGRGADFTMDLPPRHQRAVRALNGREVVLGVRPEDLDVRPHGDDAHIQFPATVDVIEPLGSEAYLYAHVLGATAVARVPAHFSARPGDRVTLYAQADKLYLFDPEGEANLLLEDTALGQRPVVSGSAM